jgi:hypothetical protein
MSRTCSDHTRALVYARDGYQCVRCGRADDLSLHHLRPRRLGGRAHHTNLVTLCRPCHDDIEGWAREIGKTVMALLVWLIMGPALRALRGRRSSPHAPRLRLSARIPLTPTAPLLDGRAGIIGIGTEDTAITRLRA